MNGRTVATPRNGHVFLGQGHSRAERRTWAVIWLCAAVMVAEIVGGSLFGSLALVADGVHMSTHAGALLLAAIAYRYARRHADDPRFTMGTGKLGDLAGFTSAIILGAIALLVAYEAILRLFSPVPIRFAEVIPIACLGLAVNVASAWLLMGGPGHEHAGHEHAGHGHTGHEHGGHAHAHDETHGGARRREGRMERDNNMRAAVVHVVADAAVSVLVIGGLLLARGFGWLWMDPAVGIAGAAVIGSWSFSLIRDTGAILLDMDPDRAMAGDLRAAIEAAGDRVLDLHVWRVGPGHLCLVASVETAAARGPEFYHDLLAGFSALSHLTIEVRRMAAAA